MVVLNIRRCVKAADSGAPLGKLDCAGAARRGPRRHSSSPPLLTCSLSPPSRAQSWSIPMRATRGRAGRKCGAVVQDRWMPWPLTPGCRANVVARDRDARVRGTKAAPGTVPRSLALVQAWRSSSRGCCSSPSRTSRSTLSTRRTPGAHTAAGAPCLAFCLISSILLCLTLGVAWRVAWWSEVGCTLSFFPPP